MIFKHYILTRWNLGMYDKNNPYHQIVKDPDIWVRTRMNLFEKYCLPAMQKQVNKNFTWVLAFSDKTPENIIARYDYIENIKIVYEQPHLWLRKQYPVADWLITSRLDNDDMYNANFTDAIQTQFQCEEEVIDIDYVAMEMATGKEYTSGRERANSPFLSLVERWDKEPCTALGHPHTDMPNYFPARKLKEPYAVQIIHGNNVSNKIRGVEICRS